MAVARIKTNSSYFFKFANKFRKTVSKPNILQSGDGKLIFDKKKIADMLQHQFNSVFSTPKENSNPYVLPKKPNIVYPLTDLTIEKEDIVQAINHLKMSSSGPKSEIPAES